MNNPNITAVPLSSATAGSIPTAEAASNNKRKLDSGRGAAEEDDEDEDDEGSDVSMINVDFDFYNPNPLLDDIALKRLLSQLLHTDSQLFDIHALASYILSEASRMRVGSTVKVDGEESDPYAYVSVVDLGLKSDVMAPLVDYLVSQLPEGGETGPFRDLLSSSSSSTSAAAAANNAVTGPRIALIISERLVNLPVQLMPPMYKMMTDEVGTRVSEGVIPRGFTHYLLLSRVYKMEGDEDEGSWDVNMDGSAAANGRPNKKAKKPKSGASAAGLPLPLPGSIFHYHPEEEFLERSATHIHTYEFKTAQARTEESFGVEQRGRISIYEAPRLGEGIKAMQEGCT